MRRKRRQSTGANSSANSLRNLGGIPSGPDALFVLRDDKTLRTLRGEIMGGHIGLDRGLVGGSVASESLRVEFSEKREPKRVALSVGELAIEPSGRKRGGKLELQKFLENFLAKDQKAFSVGDLVRLSTFLLQKEALALRILSLQRFRAEIKAA